MRYILSRDVSDRGDDTVVIGLRGESIDQNGRWRIRVRRGAREAVLSLSQARIFRLLAVHGSATHAALMDILWMERADGGPDTARRTLDVFMAYIRKRLKPLGITIKNQHDHGFYLVAT